MSKTQVLELLAGHTAFDHEEARNLVLTEHFVRQAPRPFDRVHDWGGHLCGSALVTNLDGSRVLLNKHGTIGRYMQFGGHADGETDMFGVAARELAEEAGIEGARTSGQLFDVDVHYIAPHMRKGEVVPPHVHYDLVWLFQVPDDVAFKMSEESSELQWFELAEAQALDLQAPVKNPQLQRLFAKVAAGLR